MPGIPRADPEQFIQCAPVLHVDNVLQTVSFYCDLLGFHSDFGDAQYAVVWRENAAIHFTRRSIRTAGIHLFVWIRDVGAYYTEIRSRGVEIERDPANQPYGIRDFSLLDCNGTRIVFGQDNELI